MKENLMNKNWTVIFLKEVLLGQNKFKAIHAYCLIVPQKFLKIANTWEDTIIFNIFAKFEGK